MRMPLSSQYALTLLLLPLLVLTGSTIHADQGGVVETFKNATNPVTYEAHLNLDPVVPIETVQVKNRYQGGVFWTDSRKARIQRFRCSQCHNDQKVTGTQASEITHGNIKLDHGGGDRPLDCLTCHRKDQRDYLVTEKGEKVDMDHSYRICSQCHFRQNRDWVGGAHGKRISFWAGRRVARNCVSCHDPHSPHFAKRWPITYSSPSAR